ncbi:DUF4145 domain-containing protein [Vibrio vulnificus]|nr:DUF4145 domain-containing protein [Vibrio parahaemolyticus O1]ELA8169761.1 DUF4145 domain-containing protein [Vibrio parahaemolyticus]MCU8183832.1 DUF4145 domain-containing protein [Vibrio vulnificus]MCU8219940.1 DUF4145 domain-containing protein [Vibrio vulnificus]
MAQKKIRSYCRRCANRTNHVVLSEHLESEREEYAYDHTFQITECLGCNTKSFREVYEEIEHAYQISDTDWEIPTSVDVYPKFIVGHREFEGGYHLPSLVERIYKEVLLAIQEDALILAGLGLRGTVEAVCNDLGISGRSLDIRISKLATAGYISKRDVERLHGIRFMGNDAAHELKKPKQEQLSVALKIVEHLLASVYVLEKEAQGKLETMITEYPKFEKLIEEHLEQFTVGEELPMLAILGRDIRRVKDSIVNLETELAEQIRNGKFPKLSVGKVDKYGNSQNDLQHYIVS